MPAVEIKNNGRRPALSQYTAARAASIKFQSAFDKLDNKPDEIEISQDILSGGTLTEASVDQGDLNRSRNADRL